MAKAEMTQRVQARRGKPGRRGGVENRGVENRAWKTGSGKPGVENRDGVENRGGKPGGGKPGRDPNTMAESA